MALTGKFVYIYVYVYMELQSGVILAVYCMELLHAITCSFQKYFRILYIFAHIFK